jgi:hypothetical protein
VAGEELVVVRSIEAERLPLFGYCMIGDNGELLPVGTLALVEKVEWSKLTSEEGGLPDEEGNPWTPWGGSDDQSKAIVKCVGVQRFKILSLETREPYPIAHVELFTDENTEHQEPELDEVLSQVENVATETMTEVLRIGGELVGDIAKAEIEGTQFTCFTSTKTHTHPSELRRRQVANVKVCPRRSWYRTDSLVSCWPDGLADW